MLLMIFASHHLSACCSPSSGLQSLLQLINLAQPGCARAAGLGRTCCDPRQRGGCQWGSLAGTPPQNQPRCSFKGWGGVGGAGEAPPAPTAPPHCREGSFWCSHGKALSLGVKDGASEPVECPQAGDSPDQGPLGCASCRCSGWWVRDSVINPHPGFKSAEWKAIPWRSRRVQRGI